MSRRGRHGDRHARSNACGRRSSGIRGAYRKPCRGHQGHQIRYRGRDAPGNIREEMMYYVVTGAAGFIGSKIVEALNRTASRTSSPWTTCNSGQGEEPRRLRHCRLRRQTELSPSSTSTRARGRRAASGACSTPWSPTAAHDGEQLRYSKILLECARKRKCAALRVVGLGLRLGPRVPRGAARERPLQRLRHSKFLFDQVVRERLAARPPNRGLALFQRLWANEAHKGRMASVAFHAYGSCGARPGEAVVGSGGYATASSAATSSTSTTWWSEPLFLEQRDLSGISIAAPAARRLSTSSPRR